MSIFALAQILIRFQVIEVFGPKVWARWRQFWRLHFGQTMVQSAWKKRPEQTTFGRNKLADYTWQPVCRLVSMSRKLLEPDPCLWGRLLEMSLILGGASLLAWWLCIRSRPPELSLVISGRH